MPSSNITGGTLHSAVIKPDSACAAGGFTLQMTTPKGKASAFTFSSQ